jgi:hypothetical protein
MTIVYVAPIDAAADLRWQRWLARGAESDRRTTRRMRLVMLVIAMALGVAFYVA